MASQTDEILVGRNAPDPDTVPDPRDSEDVNARLAELRQKAPAKVEKEITDSDILLLWVPALNARYYRAISPEGAEKIIDRIGKMEQDKLDGLHAYVADRILIDLNRIPSAGLIKRIAYVWRVMSHAKAGTIYVHSVEERFAQIWEEHFVEAPGRRVDAHSVSMTLRYQGGLSTHEHHEWTQWAERKHAVVKGRKAKERWYEGMLHVATMQAEKRKAEKEAADLADKILVGRNAPDPDTVPDARDSVTGDSPPAPVTPDDDK